jgi:hypothetical protein
MRKLLLVLVAMLLVSGAALAQDATPEVFCSDLAAEDCAILEQSQAAMASLESVAFDFQADLTISDIPDVDGPVSFGLSGDGAFSGDKSAVMDSEAAMAAMQDPLAMMTMAVEGLRSFDADLSFTLTLPQALVEAEEGVPESVTLELRFVDGTGYLNFDTLAPLFSEADAQVPFQGWLGLDIASFIEAIVEESPELFEGMVMSGFDPTMYAQFSDPNAFAQYATITRTDDGSGDTATFTTTFDFAGMFADPEFQAMMREQMEAQIEMQGEDVDEEDIELGFAASQAMFAESEFVSTTTIDLATGYQTGGSLSMSFDMTAMMEMMEEAGEDVGEGAAPRFEVTAAFNLSQFNEVPEITEPEGANVIPFESLLGMAAPGMTPGMGADDGEGAMETPEAEATEAK